MPRLVKNTEYYTLPNFLSAARAHQRKERRSSSQSPRKVKKIRRGPKLEGYAFANFGYSSETAGEAHHEMGN